MATFRGDLTKYQSLIVHHSKVTDRLIATIFLEKRFSASNSKLNSNKIIFIAFLPRNDFIAVIISNFNDGEIFNS